MPGNDYFQFKQFKIIQKKAAMRVGTDGVLLGAWANPEGAKTILDVGTGTGVIALMLAQRSNALITAVEIEQQAATEALTNAKNSPWADRINVIHDSFQNFTGSYSKTFDLIVSNPPFFINDKRPKSHTLSVARHGDTLSLHDILKGTDRLIDTKSRLALILPVSSAEIFIRLAENYKLNLSKLTEVKPAEGRKTNRFLMEFSKINHRVQKNNIAIRDAANEGFTEEFKRLTRHFYLNF